MENKNDSFLVNIIKSILPIENIKELDVTNKEDFEKVINNLDSIKDSISKISSSSLFGKLFLNDSVNDINKCVDELKDIVIEKYNEGNSKQSEIINEEKVMFPSDLCNDEDALKNIADLVQEFSDEWIGKFPDLDNTSKYALYGLLYEFGCWVLLQR